MPALRIGEILIAEGVLTEAAVNRALGYQRVSGEHIKLGTILLNWDLLAEEGLLKALARFHRVEPAPWSVLSSAPIQATRVIPPAMAIRLGAFPFAETRTTVKVAFVEPSNLAAADEVAAVANKRVIPAVSLEIRLLQAHQKFYGRHIPLEYRSIVQKLERRTTKTTLPDWQKTVDFRVPDIEEAEKSGRLTPPPPPGIRNPPMDLTRAPLEHGPGRQAGKPIRVSRGLADTELDRNAVPTIEIPEMPKLRPIPISSDDRLSDTNPLSASAVARERSLSDTHPVRPAPPAPKPAPEEKTPLDDTLPKRMGAPFASLSGSAGPLHPEPAEVVEKIDFQPDPPPSGSRSIRPPERDFDETLPRGASAHLEPGGSIADMWHPAPPEEDADAPDEAAAARQWTPSRADIEASIGEARTREEIWKVALETFLVKVPRVVLFGCGKSAVTGWQGRGEAVTAEFVASVRVPLSGDTVFDNILASGVPHFGPLDQVQWPAELAQRLGAQAPDCAVFPIRILDGIAAFLYADRLGAPMHYEDFAIVARASAATANALSRFLLRRGSTAPVS